METLKILVVSQKGGVGKSTLSTNFVAWYGEKKKQPSVLLALDPHASSSTWLKELSPRNVNFKEVSSSDFSAQRWFMGARTIIRKVNGTCNVAVADVTWTSGMNSDFLKEFDLVIVPTSVSQLDIDATQDFIQQNISSFQKKNSSFANKRLPPSLMLLPSMVTNEQLKTNPFTNKNFNFPFLLLPPIPYDTNVRSLFKNDFVHQSKLHTKHLFEICFEAISQAGKVKLKEKTAKLTKKTSLQKIERIQGNPSFSTNQVKKIWATKTNVHDNQNIARIIKSEEKNTKSFIRKKSWLEKITSW